MKMLTLSPLEMDSNQELAELKKDGIGKAISLLRNQWNNLDIHLHSTECYLEERLTELQSREKRLISFQQSVADSHKYLDSVLQSLEERVKYVEHKENQLDRIRKSVDQRIKEVEIREEKLDLEMKRLENIKKSTDERVEAINRREMQLDSKETMLKSARKCIKNVLESCSNGKKRKQLSGESSKHHKNSDVCPGEQMESMTVNENMSTQEQADFQRETVVYRRRSCQEFQITPEHSVGTKEGDQGDFTYSKENASLCLTNDEKLESTSNKVPKEVLFYDFAGERSWEKVKTGQIWAMYDEDGLPNRYVEIRHVEIKDITSNSYRLHLQPFEPFTTSQSLCCGIFRAQEGKEFYSESSLSHMVKEQSISTIFLEIYPKKGQVWAIYDNWKEDLSNSDIKKFCCRDIVEVLEDNEQSIKVSPLVRVSSFMSVFRAARFSNVLVIPRGELARFSHKIPAFKLIGENEGKLRGYWELDPAAVPGYI